MRCKDRWDLWSSSAWLSLYFQVFRRKKIVWRLYLPCFTYLKKKSLILYTFKMLDNRCTKTHSRQENLLSNLVFRQCILVQLVYRVEFLLLIRYWGEEKSIIATIQFIAAWQGKGFNGVPLFQWVIPVRGNANEKGQKMACIHFLIWNVNVLLKIYHWRQEWNSFMKCRLTTQSIFWESDLYTGNAVWEQQANAVCLLWNSLAWWVSWKGFYKLVRSAKVNVKYNLLS